ncbi:retrotransposon protein, putative, ty1-copia subclass [Tanacetum coccineum]
MPANQNTCIAWLSGQPQMTTTVVNNSLFRTFFEKQKLTGINFMEWYRNLRIVLSVEDKLPFLEQPIPAMPVPPAGQVLPPDVLNTHTAWVKASKEIAGLMLMTMDPDIQKNLEHLGAYDMLKELKTLYAQQADQELLQTVREFHACKQEEGQSVSSYVLKMKSYIDNLERLGHAMTQNLSQTLPPKEVVPSLHAIRAGRIQENQKKKSHKAAKGNQGKGKAKMVYAPVPVPPFAPKPKNPPTPKKDNPAKDAICHQCGEVGIFTIELYSFPSTSWVYDTGCGTHICITTQGLRGSRKLKPGALSLYVSDGHRAAVEVIGEFHLRLPSGLVLILHNCHYAPSITRGIISVSRLYKDGFVNLFDNDNSISISRNNLIYFNAIPRDDIYEIAVAAYVLQMKGYVEQLERLGYMLPQDLIVAKNPKPSAKDHPAKDDTYHYCKEVGHWKRKCLVYLAELLKKKKQVGSASSSGGFFFFSKNNVFYFNAIPSNGIYEIDMHDLVPNDNSIYNVSTKRAKHNLDSTYLWHCRLAHISKKRIEKLQQEGLLKSTDDESFDQCVSCLSGKMTRKSFPHRPERATDLLGIIHTDVCGPLRHVSRQGASYFITFTDDYSRYGYVYLLKHKHEVFETFKVFKNEVENQLGKTIKALRSDRGGEYISQEFKDYLKACGIVQQLTPPYTPQHNGVSERRNRTLLDMVRSMMNLTTLPLSFWDYALESYQHDSQIWFQTEKVNKTPYELWYGKVPNLSYLKV